MSYFLETRDESYISNFKSSRLNLKTLSQNISYSTWTFCSGSEISYTPDAKADYVVYEYNFYTDTLNSHTLISTRLVESTDGGSTFTTVSGQTAQFNSGDSSIQVETTCNIKFLLDNWGDSSRILRIEGLGNSGANRDARLHRVGSFKYGSSTETRYFIPTVSCYSIKSI